MSPDDAQGELQLATSHEWVRVVSGIDFSTAAAVQAMDPKRRPAGRTIKLVAFRLAWWADADGTRLFPSIGRIAAVCEIDYKTGQTCVRVLRETGLLDRVTHGGGHGARKRDGNEYRLTIPTDLLERVKHRSPDELTTLAQELTPVRAPRPSRAKSGGMNTHPEDPMSGGMTPPTDGSPVGCPPHVWGDAHQVPTTDLPPTPPTTTSPEVPTSPVPVDDTADLDVDVRPDVPPEQRRTVTAGAAACRASLPRNRSAAPDRSPTS